MEKVSGWMLGLCLTASSVGLAATPASVSDQDAPDLELLEYLGEWSGEGEAWLQQQEKVSDENAAPASQKSEVNKHE